jgi:asparagine synthase (glutamine-hydrolysing)
MCGICGVAGGDPVRERDHVRAMVAALGHRGPDDHGVIGTGPVTLGNTRLAILDLSEAGHQPLGGGEHAGWITYNGEVYNYRELRAELERNGVRFRSGTDTEVILALYLRHGADCLGRLRGMFAFAIWDERRRRLFAARDHFGQKPFYYVDAGGTLLFASEIKSLLTHPDVSAAPEPAAIDHYLSLRVVPPPLTMFRGIRKLPAGHWLEWDPHGGVRTGRYWQPRFDAHPRDGQRSDDDWVAELKGRLGHAVDRHRVSDVPVGAMLSGGLDSSVVVAELVRHSAGTVRTFCIGSDHPAFDERPYARMMAEHAGTEHHEVVVEPDFLGRIPWLVHALDEPSDPISACFEEAARLAAAHVKVVMGGDGGDEIFAGFDRYAAFRMADRYAMLPRWLREDLLRPALRALPQALAYKSVGQRARWLDSVAQARGGRLYARMTSHFRFRPEHRAELYGPGLRSALESVDALEAIAAPFEAAPSDSALDRMIYADLLTRLPEHTLMLADRLSMAHSLEVRSPLLDVDLAEFCLAMPPRLRIRRGTTKYALRRAAESRLPAPLLRRGKQGFMFPVAYWLNGATLRTLQAGLVTGPLVEEGWIQPEAIRRLVAEHDRRVDDHHVRLWQLASLDAWHRIYLGGEPVASIQATSSRTGVA